MADYDGEVLLGVKLKPKDIQQSARNLSDTISAVFKANAGKELTSTLKAIQARIDKTNTKSQALNKTIDELASKRVKSDAFIELENEMKKVENEAEIVSEKLSKISTTDGYSSKSIAKEGFSQSDVDKLVAELDKLSEKYTEISQKQESLIESGKNLQFTNEKDAKYYENAVNKLQEYNNQQAVNIARWNELARKQGDAVVSAEAVKQAEEEAAQALEKNGEATGKATQTYEEYKQKSDQVWKNMASLITQSVQNLPQTMRNIASGMLAPIKAVSSKFAEVFKEGASQGVQELNKAFSGLIVKAKQLASTLAGKLKSGLKSLTSNLVKATKNTKGLDINFGKLLKKLLAYGLGIRSIYALFRKLRGAISDGIKEIVLINDGVNDTNKSMTALTSSFTAFKRSIAAAAVPILNTFAPALTRIIDGATKATNAIGKLIAALTGKSTYLQAVKVQKDYAESLQESAKNSKKAKKENEGYLSSIDEINKFQSKKEEDNTNTGIGEGFEEVPIESKIKDWAKKLKDAWANADFTSIGKMLGDKLAEALASINWDKIQSEARRLAQSLATFINGFIQGEFNGIGLGWWIGNAIAEALNTAIEFVNKFLTTVHWDEVGDFFGDMANGWIESFDFDGFFMQFTNALNALGDFLLNFSEKVKWEDLGSNIAKGINKALKELDMAKLAQGISSFIEGVMSSIITFIEDTDWKQVGEKLVEFITNLDWKGILEKAGEGLDALVHAILDFLAGVFGENDPGVIGVLSAAIDTLKAALDALKPVAEKFYEAVLKPLGDFLWDKLHDALSSIKEILEGLTDVLNGNKSFKEFFDGLSFGQKIVVVLTTVLTALAVVIGVVTAVTGALTIVIGILTSPITLVIAAIVALIAIGVALYENWDTIKKKAGELWDGIKEGFGKFVDKIKEIVNGIKEHFQHAFDTVKRNWGKFTDSIKTAFTNFKTFWTNTWNSIKSTVVSIFEGIWNKIKSICNSILGGIEKMVNGVIKGFNRMIGALNSLSFDVPDWVPEIGGGRLGFNIRELSTVSLPRLAQGAVIPPNKEFAAVLGDQKQGMNIETPLETMKQAFRDALSEMGGNTGTQTIQFILPNKKMVAEYVIEGGRILQSSRGSNPFELA